MRIAECGMRIAECESLNDAIECYKILNRLFQFHLALAILGWME